MFATFQFQTGGERVVSGRLIAAYAPQTLGTDESWLRSGRLASTAQPITSVLPNRFLVPTLLSPGKLPENIRSVTRQLLTCFKAISSLTGGLFPFSIQSSRLPKVWASATSRFQVTITTGQHGVTPTHGTT